MKIKNISQTIIFICCLVVIPVFCFSFFLYSKADLKYYEILDKSFTATFGFFGGAATLAAAYIASLLFNDWRKPHKATFYSNECKNVINCYKDLLINKRKLSILESQVKELIYSNNGLKKINPNFLSKEAKVQLTVLNNEIEKEIEALFTSLTKMVAELSMLSSLTEDHEYLIECISLQISLTKSYKEILYCNNIDQPYEIFDKLQEANKNNYLFIQGKTLISKIKILGEV